MQLFKSVCACCVSRKYVEEWMAMGGKGEMRNYVRDLNAFTSQEVFAGEHIWRCSK